MTTSTVDLGAMVRPHSVRRFLCALLGHPIRRSEARILVRMARRAATRDELLIVTGGCRCGYARPWLVSPEWGRR